VAVRRLEKGVEDRRWRRQRVIAGAERPVEINSIALSQIFQILKKAHVVHGYGNRSSAITPRSKFPSAS